MDNWYYFRDGEQLGPVGFATLQHMAANGELTAQDQVWQEGTAAWVDASQVGGLFPAPPASRPKAKPAVPVSNKQKFVLLGALLVIVLGSTAIVWLLIMNRHSDNPPTVAVPPRGEADTSTPSTPSGSTSDLATRIADRGMKSLHGDGVPKDIPKAVQLLHQASQLGNVDAALTLAKIYAAGDGVKKDDALAVEHFAMAAKKGNAEAMTALGSAYEHGTGIAADPVAAKSWYDKAAAAKSKGG